LILDDFLIEAAHTNAAPQMAPADAVAAGTSHLVGCGERTFHAPEEVPDAKSAQVHAMVERDFSGDPGGGMDAGSVGSAAHAHQPEPSFGHKRRRGVYADHQRNGLHIGIEGGMGQRSAGDNL
jgi:hypothetical protein